MKNASALMAETGNITDECKAGVGFMGKINYLVGGEGISNRPLEPYSQEVCDFASALSESLLKDAQAKRYPDIMTFAFWCRKGNIRAKKEKWLGKKETRLGRGLVFQTAPSNVPINFAFTYMFALLAGNATIVRAPSKEFPQIALVCRKINEILGQFPEIGKRTALVQYPAESEITEQFSLRADVRVIWGGDATVSKIRQCKTKPKCIDLVFADRYSICIINGKAVEQAQEKTLRKLAEDFYNDTFLMDQNACSSPQMIFWENASDQAKDKFWQAVYCYAKAQYDLQAASCVDKYTKFCQDAVDNLEFGKGYRLENLIYRVTLKALPQDITDIRGNCGYFYEYDLQDREELCNIITEKFQTITYYGMEASDLQNWIVQNHVRGIDRIVPVGKSLDIDVIWDGYDIIGMLSRIIEAVS